MENMYSHTGRLRIHYDLTPLPPKKIVLVQTHSPPKEKILKNDGKNEYLQYKHPCLDN